MEKLENDFRRLRVTSDGIMKTWLKEDNEDESKNLERMRKDAFRSHKKERSE